MNRMRLHATLTDDELIIIDRIAEKLGYTSRTDLETELDTLRDAFFDVLDEYAFPVIAMHGADHACCALANDLKTWMYMKCKAVPQEADMKEWIKIYAAIKKGDIIRYRILRTTEEFAEEYEDKEQEAYA